MGKVKIKKKSTFIDMTAMSDVTVLLLTFFMLTSTFLQKEPTIVYTPSSVSEEKVPSSNLVTVLVSSADKAAKEGEDPTATEGKIFISFAGDIDSTYSSATVRRMMLEKAIEIYNDQQEKQHKSGNKINLTPAQIKTFSETNMMGTSFKHLPELLSMNLTQIDKEQGDLRNPNTGIPINANKDKEGVLNDFQIWCKAIYLVARDIREDKANNLGLSTEEAKQLQDLLAAVTKDGKGVAIKADKDTPFATVELIFDNLQTMSLNKFSLLTALTSEDEVSSTPSK